jgi:hypothetical protein
MKNPVLTGFFLLVLVAGFIYSGHRLHLSQAQLGRELVAPPRGLEHFHFGFRYAMADTFWVRAIQDFDFCEQSLGQHLCKGKGWLFQTLDVVTTLDPQFRMAYSAGGMALSVIISDIEGASLLFDRAVEHFPQDELLLLKAAYHALYEEKNPGKAAGLMERAAKNGAPEWTYTLAGRLYTEAGQRELAERVLAEMKDVGVDPAFQERLRQKLMEKTIAPRAN